MVDRASEGAIEDGAPVDDPSGSGFEATTSEQLGLGLPSSSLTDRIDELVERLDGWRDQPVVVGMALFVGMALLAVVAAVLVGRQLLGVSTSRAPIDNRIPQVTLAPTTATVSPGIVVVHVSGAVRTPGVYTLASSARVVDAIDAAGGATAQADLHLLNLAAVLEDGQQIRVPLPGEEPPPSTAERSGPLDLNRADALQLQELSGVGPATAAAIVAHREEHGPFRAVDDLLDVPGIGPAKLDAIVDDVVVR